MNHRDANQMIGREANPAYKRMGTLLCECEKKIADKINLTEISEWMSENHPATIIRTSNALCKKPNEINTFIKQHKITNIIIGACKRYRELFEEMARKTDLKPFCIRTVGLLEQCVRVHSKEHTEEKAKILLSAAIYREKNSSEIPSENLRFATTRPDKKMGRRAFLMFPLKLYAKLIPTIAQNLCARWRGCDLCINACPKQAIIEQKRKMRIDASKCESCGICAVTCPTSAICFPGYSLTQIDEEVRALVSANAGFLEQRIILFACSGGASLVNELADKGLSYPHNLMVIEVPCIGMITPLIILRAFDLGAAGLGLVSCQGKCQYGYDLNLMHENVQISGELLEILGIGSERVCAITPSDDNTLEFHNQLKMFTEKMMRMELHPLRWKEPSEIKNSGRNLPYMLKQIVDKLNIDKNIQVHSSKLPFCIVEVDNEKCSMCGLCASRCPTNAMNLKKEGKFVKLLFSYDLCIACGICLEHCPQKAMRIKRVLDLGRLESPVSILLEDKMAKCHICGLVFLPQRQIKIVSNRLSDKPSNYFQLISKYCPNCRLKAPLGT